MCVCVCVVCVREREREREREERERERERERGVKGGGVNRYVDFLINTVDAEKPSKGTPFTGT